jgi:hypothetical protein
MSGPSPKKPNMTLFFETPTVFYQSPQISPPSTGIVTPVM